MLHYKLIKREIPTSGESKFYAQLLTVNPMTLEELADNISSSTTVTSHDIKAVLSALERQIYRFLRNGHSVRLGDLGTFYPTIQCRCVPTEKEFNPARIKVFPRYLKSARMRTELSRVNPLVSFCESKEESASADKPLGPLGPGSGGGGGGISGDGSSEGHM